MNKWLLCLIILLIPVIVAGIWILSMTGDGFTVSNVSSVTLVYPDMTSTEYVTDSEKEFFVEFKKNIVSIEEQDVDFDDYTVYELHFERVQGDVGYTLCLSADVKNCLAFDTNGNWYRIDKDYARQFLARHDASEVYKHSTVPTLAFSSNGVTKAVSPTNAKWFYLLADESYTELSVNEAVSDTPILNVISTDGFEFSFDLDPDWYNVKIYENDRLIYDGLLDSVTSFSYFGEADLRAVISAEWYEDTTPLYHGNANYEFYFSYDIKATYSISKDTVSSGEVLFLRVLNANDETLTVESSFSPDVTYSSYLYNGAKIVLIPVPVQVKTGEYHISVTSDKTSLSIPVTVNARDYGTVTVGFIGSESALEYNSALTLFKQELSSANSVVLDTPYWTNGLSCPINKFVNGREQYWVSLPSFGVTQKVGGTVIDERSSGIHYVKSVEAQSLPVYAVAEGVVAFSGVTTAYGNTLVIEHGFGFKSVYGHLDSLAFIAGDRVSAGALLGNASPSGFAVSPTEAFFAICVGDTFVNPYNFINEPRTQSDSTVSEPIEFFKGE